MSEVYVICFGAESLEWCEEYFGSLLIKTLFVSTNFIEKFPPVCFLI